MTPKELINAFEVLADAPGGIDSLRELVLQLAMQGKLVAQNPLDQPIQKALEAVRADRGPVVNARVNGRSEVPRVPEEWELPFELPAGWSWARLDDTGEYVNGLAFKQKDWHESGLPIIRIQNLTDFAKPFNYARGDFPEDRLVKDGDILVSWSATLEAFIWNRGDAVLNQHIFRVVPENQVVTDQFLFHLCRRTIREMAESEKSHGLVMKHINRGPFLSHVIGVPPLAEQQRIVERLDELIALLDRLEAAQGSREATRQALRDAALSTLRDAVDPETVQAAWTRVASQMEDLFTDPTDVPVLRQTILQLAVRGRLVPQQPNDEPARGLLARAGAEKARLQQENLIKNQKPLATVEPDEVPFEVPDGWQWARIDDLFFVSGGLQKSGKRRPDRNAFPYLRVANVQRGRLDLTEIKEMELFDGELERLRLESGDLLVVEGNGSADEIGRCARWEGEIEDCVHQNHLIRCRPLEQATEHFVLRFLNSPSGIETMKSLAVTTSGLYNLSVGKIRKIVVPVAPLAEQRRIVDRVDELIGLCDELEARLACARDTRASFANSAVASFA